MSPLLFALAEHCLSRYLQSLVDYDLLHPMSTNRGVSALTHLLYADDVLLFFYTGTVHNLQTISHAFNLYGLLSR